MWDFSIFRALGLVIRTLPFIVLRASVYLGIAAAVAVAAGAGAGLGHALGSLADATAQGSTAVWGGVVGLGLAAALVHLLRGQVLYGVTAGHLALMVEALDGRRLPFGRGQIVRARAIVRDRFGEAPALVALDKLVRGVIRTATGLVDGLLVDILPIRALDRLSRATGLHLGLAGGLIDGVVLAHAARTRSENAWEAAHDGLVLYTQNARPMLGAAVWLSLVGWALAGLVFLAALSPATSVAALLPQVTGAGPLLAALLAWTAKAALYDPFALAYMLQLHLRLTQDQEPLPEWRGRLTQVSDKFRTLGERALGWSAGATQDA